MKMISSSFQRSIFRKFSPQVVVGLLSVLGVFPFVVYVFLRLTVDDPYSEFFTFFRYILVYGPPSAIFIFLVGWSVGVFYWNQNKEFKNSILLPSLILGFSGIVLILYFSVLLFWIWSKEGDKAEVEKYYSSSLLRRSSIVLSGIASNPNTSASVLDEIIDEETSERVLRKVARNSNLSAEGFKKLGADSNRYVLADLAANSKLPLFLIENLVSNPDPIVQKSLANNASLPVEALEKLSDSIYEDVKIAISIHPNVSAAILEKLSNETSENVRKSVASNQRATSQLLTKLSTDPSGDVRYAVAKNMQTPVDILHHMMNDADERARSTAQGRMKSL